METLGKLVIPLGMGSVAQTAVRLIPALKLDPLADWEFSPITLAFFCSLSGAAIGLLIPYRNARLGIRAIAVMISLCITVITIYGYFLITSKPPTVENETWYDWGAFLTYFGSYLSTGYLLSYVCSVLADRQTPKDKKAKTDVQPHEDD